MTKDEKKKVIYSILFSIGLIFLGIILAKIIIMLKN